MLRTSLQIRYSRQRIYIFKLLVSAAAVCFLRNFAFVVIKTPEDDRIRGAGLRTGRHHFAVEYFAVLGSGRILTDMNALDAEGAFFHHTALAYGHVRVELIRQGRGQRPVAPVELAHLVRTVI